MDKMKKEGLQNPQKEFYNDKYPTQMQEPPGLQDKMKPTPDSGEERYKGYGRLKGRKALITGGDSGIGRAVAIAYAREGADVAINFLPEEREDAESLAELLRKEDRKVVLIPGDIRKESFNKEMVENAYRELGGLDILVLNAAVQVAKEDIREITSDQLYRTFETNLFSQFWAVQAALPMLPEGASILFTASSEYYSPSETLLDYAASKFAIVGFSRALAKQLIDKGIRVNTVLPGPVWTPLEISGGLLKEEIAEHGADTPLKRSGQPVELAGVYVFLASDEATYITAETYGVAGGIHGT